MSFVLIASFLSGCSYKSILTDTLLDRKIEDEEAQETVSANIPDEQTLEGTVRAVIVNIDLKNNSLAFSHLDTGKQYELKIDNSTLIHSRYGDIMVPEQLNPGDIADITASLHSGLIKTIDEVNGFEYSGITDYDYNVNKGVFTADDVNYRITDSTIIVEDGHIVDFDDIVTGDSLKIAGISHDLYSITIEKGIGHVRLTGGEFYEGGVVEIGNTVANLEENLLLDVPEGQYNLKVYYKGNTAGRALKVLRGQETKVDLTVFKGDLIKYGRVTFTFDPPTAPVKVRIDGKQVEFMRPVKLEYGVHNLLITAEGFRTIKSKIRVASEMANIDLVLEEAVSENKTPVTPPSTNNTLPPDTFKNSSTSTSSTSTSSSSSSSAVTGATEDSSAIETGSTTNQLYIDSPEGAEVYFDGAYKGMAPIHFTKTSGTHVVVLRKDGYRTKTYTLNLAATTENETYSFSDLEKLEDDENE
ncbi:MAG: PEGA domain-containing protein [Lachnospiraceae bacterium]|nr:PEGA domain-containing protein [Lachnospiraceae bacterium]